MLSVARHYFDAFARPEGQAWIAAVSKALELFGAKRGPEVSVAVLIAVQAMRQARRSTFRFSNPDCAICSAFATQHERSLMASLRAAARGRRDDAAAHAAILCEGNDVRALVHALEVLAQRAFTQNAPVAATDEQQASHSKAGA